MKSNFTRKMLLPLLMSVLSLNALAGHLEDKLEAIFDDIVLNKKLSAQNLSELSKDGKTQVLVALSKEPELLALSLTRESGLHLTSFKNNFKKHKNPQAILNAESTEFQITYRYGNLLGGSVDYRFAFKGDAIKDFCAPKDEVKVALVEPPSVLAALASALMPTLPQEATLPTRPAQPTQLIASAADSNDDYHSLSSSAGDDSFFDCEDGSTSDSVLPSSSTPSVRIRLLSSTLSDMSVLFNKAMVVGSEADHVWAMVANGTRGFVNLYDAFANFNVCSAVVGVADVASAVVGSVRLCKALNGGSAQTNELFRELDTKLDLISGISSEMAEVLVQVKAGLGQVNASLDKSVSFQEKLLAEWTHVNSEADERVQKALELLKNAQIDHSKARIRLGDIAVAAELIENGWAQIKTQLETLGELSAQDAAVVTDARELVKVKLETIQSQIEEIQSGIRSLEEPMKLVNEFILEIAELNASTSTYFAESVNHLLATLELNAKAEQNCRLLSKENDELKECLRLNTVSESQVAELQAQNRKLELTTTEAGVGVIKLKAAVEKKYDLKHLLVGASVAVLMASVLTVGALPAAGLGLVTAHTAKAFDYALIRGDSGDSEFHTSVGLLAHKFGVSKSFIKGVGERLGYKY